MREFDTVAGRFVDGGFHLPEGKHRVDWIDKDTLFVATDWTKADVTTSGYPFIAKVLKRGQPLAAATEVFRGTKADGGYGVQSVVLNEPDGKVAALVIQRPLDTFNAEYYLLTGARTARLDLPKKSTIQGYVSGRLIVSLEEDWAAKALKEGDLVDFDLDEVKAAPGMLKPSLVVRPTPSQSVEQVATTRGRLVLVLLDNVKGQVRSLKRTGGSWTVSALDLPKDPPSIDSAADTTQPGGQCRRLPDALSQWLADAGRRR